MHSNHAKAQQAVPLSSRLLSETVSSSSTTSLGAGEMEHQGLPAGTDCCTAEQPQCAGTSCYEYTQSQANSC
jgi:hypothetical protein